MNTSRPHGNKKATRRKAGKVATSAGMAGGRRRVDIALRCEVRAVATVELVDGVPHVVAVRITDLALDALNSDARECNCEILK